ncbi:hypothetical protein CFC21_026219 [Triticum aestivum]|uniref:BZIP domain-containing protein n=2 Tax=Triticum aestivum TaxID=4565 RepID=A0A3B6CFP0_WHEAT|nr:hypothetical protein CFC21_026219 [Triticum aestivum]
MEELWKDMSLCSTPLALQSYHLHSPAAAPYRGAAHPQDYLAGAVPQPPRTPPPHTALTLEFTCPGGTGAANPATSSGDDPAGCHFGLSASGGTSKRAAVQPVAGGDRRQRRMIKNRESAARMLIQREQDFINDRLAKAAQAPVPDCSSGSTTSTLQQKQQRQKRCRSAPAP